MFYLLLFLTTAVLFYLAQRAYKKDKIAFYILSYIAIFLLAWVAGCRALTVGTDTSFYGVTVFKDAAKSRTPFSDAFDDFSWIEPFYYLLNYIASCVGNINFALFLVMFVQTAFAFYGMKFFMNRAPLWTTMLAYEFMFYNLSLNMMRQGLAVTFVLFSYQYVVKGNLKKLLLMMVLGFFWHKSSVVAFLFLIALYFYRNMGEKKQQITLVLLLPISAVLVIIFSSILESLIENIPIMEQYRAYGDENGRFESGLSTIDIGSKLMMIGLMGCLYIRQVMPKIEFYTLGMVIIIELASCFLGIYTYYATRIAYYFMILEAPYVFMALNSRKVVPKTQILFNSVMIFCYGFVSFWTNIHYGNNETYPYISEIFHVVFY